MASIKIERGVPVPDNAGKRGGAGSKYPFSKMKAGDSFTVPVEDREPYKAAAYKYGTYHGQKFCCRTEGNVSRIWRIK